MNLSSIRLLILVLSFLPLVAYSFQYNIKGYIKGVENQIVYLVDMGQNYYLNEAQLIIDSCLSVDGTFEFNGKKEYPTIASIKLPDITNQYRVFIIEEGDITIDGHIESLYKALVKGGEENDVYANRNKLTSRYTSKSNALVDSMSIANRGGERWSRFKNEYDKLYNARVAEELEFVKENKSSMVSLLVLHSLLKSIDIDTIHQYFDSLDPDIKISNDGRLLARRLKVIKELKIGSASPFFRIQNIGGQEITSDKYLGKLTVIDFWATWCIPCLEKLPELKEINEKYGKKINLISISIDRDIPLWKEVVKKKEMNWENLCDGLGSRSPVAIDFNIDSIPRLLILNENSIILYDSNSSNIRLSQFLEENIHISN